MTAALEGGEWSAAHPGHTLPPGKTQYPFYRRLGGPQGQSGRAENLVPTGPDAVTRLSHVTAFGLDTHPSCLHLTSIQQQLENQATYVVTNTNIVSS